MDFPQAGAPTASSPPGSPVRSRGRARETPGIRVRAVTEPRAAPCQTSLLGGTRLGASCSGGVRQEGGRTGAAQLQVQGRPRRPSGAQLGPTSPPAPALRANTRGKKHDVKNHLCVYTACLGWGGELGHAADCCGTTPCGQLALAPRPAQPPWCCRPFIPTRSQGLF